ncbi:hypothetical protein EAH81_07745 [Flavobacterium pectinovorum]|uniref:Uncharacterized protein n=1 Tax=Flavobacterium pectinovorum TaxID=29533 RepID=A0A502F188_9FLAO|nr:hypothetical protein EAH81_07745 [Flavobacterium pectinovorum]
MWQKSKKRTIACFGNEFHRKVSKGFAQGSQKFYVLCDKIVTDFVLQSTQILPQKCKVYQPRISRISAN